MSEIAVRKAGAFISAHAGILLVFLFGLVAAGAFDAYGLGWDEPAQRTTGLINFRYVFHGDPFLLEWVDRDYGVAFELPLILLEKIFRLSDPRDIYLVRHLATHLFFLAGAWCGYRLIYFL